MIRVLIALALATSALAAPSAIPTFSPPGNTYVSDPVTRTKAVKITAPNGTVLFYSLDGGQSWKQAPAEVYTVQLPEGKTVLKALYIKPSAIKSNTYTINPPAGATPTPTPSATPTPTPTISPSPTATPTVTPAPTATPSPTPSGLTAGFLGEGQDLVGGGDSLVPDGQPDWVIHLDGLLGTPADIYWVTITSEQYSNEVYMTPYNGWNWNFLIVGDGPARDLHFAKAAATDGKYWVKVAYMDGTFAIAGTQSTTPPSPTPTPEPTTTPVPTATPSPTPVGPQITLTFNWNLSASSNVVGYRIWEGTDTGFYENSTEAGISPPFDLKIPDDHIKRYFTMTAYNSNNEESGPSNEVTYP